MSIIVTGTTGDLALSLGQGFLEELLDTPLGIKVTGKGCRKMIVMGTGFSAVEMMQAINAPILVIAER